MTEPASPRTPEINYAPPLARVRQRKFQRRLIATILLATVIATAVVWGPRMWRKAQLLYWQDKCMAYTAPADRIVYEEQAATAARLLSQPGYRRAQTNWKFPPTMDPVAFAPREFDRWRGMYTPRPAIWPTLFLHRLQNPRGDQRFIHLEAINFSTASEPQGRVIMLVWAVSKPGSWRPGDDPTLLNSSNVASTLCGFQPGDFVRFYAGQPDPADPTRFTVRVDVNGTTARIVGRLNAADKLELELQDWPRRFVPD